MNGTNFYVLLFALLLAPLTADAQVTFISEDPSPDTTGCQNPAAAFHANGDVVMVDYHGQWLTHDDGKKTQNGGYEYQGCEIERVYRMTAAGDLVWELRPTNSAEQIGFARHDRLQSMAALPGGETVITASENIFDDEMNVTVIAVDEKGAIKWHTKTKQAPKFASARVHASSSGELFVDYNFTNYAYEGGRLRLAEGPAYRVGENQMREVLVRLDPATGAIVWQKSVGGVVSVENGEILYLDTRFKYGTPSRERHRIQRMTYTGKPISSAWTRWLENETRFSAQRFGDKLVLSTRVEHRDGRRVKERSGRLRVFDFKGKLVSTREISDSTVLAHRGSGCSLHLVSPTECDRSRHGREYCSTASLDVTTLVSLDDPGVTSRIRIPRGVFATSDLLATSTRDGLWVNGITYYGKTRAPAVTIVRTLDEARPRVTEKRFVWEPKPRKPAQKELQLVF